MQNYIKVVSAICCCVFHLSVMCDFNGKKGMWYLPGEPMLMWYFVKTGKIHKEIEKPGLTCYNMLKK